MSQFQGRVEKSLLIDDAAQALGVSRRTVYYRIRDGRLQTIRTRCGSQRVLVSSIEILLRATREADERRGVGATNPASVVPRDRSPELRPDLDASRA
jgi:excisionase family DNA binding protein